jgi:hypothetical protein
VLRTRASRFRNAGIGNRSLTKVTDTHRSHACALVLRDLKQLPR